MKTKYLVKHKIILLFILSLLWIIIDRKILITDSTIKVCMCTPIKKENLYIKEFVDYYRSYNVDKIFLYDNNDIDGEHLEFVISNYVQSGFVEIINFRGKIKALYDMMNDCYKKNFLFYDWLIFYEIDEFINLKNFHDIKKFISLPKFNNCQTIQLNWLMHTDNNHLYYEDKPLKKRFVESNKLIKITGVKSILRGKIYNITINCVHRINTNLRTCDGLGRRTHLKGAGTSLLDYKYYYIDHYFCKSTQEFVNKLNKKDALYIDSNLRDRIKVYFAINKPTKEKKDYMKNHIITNISLDDLLT